MGSRLNIKIASLLSLPGVSVLLTLDADECPCAGVAFHREGLRFNFDYLSSVAGVELSTDFNFFRYGPDDPKHTLLRMLYEHSISFTVHH